MDEDFAGLVAANPEGRWREHRKSGTMLSRNFLVSSDKLGCYLRDDGIAVAAQSSHPGGNPMSQRECAGFNAPRFSVPAGDEVEVVPRTRDACLGSWSSRNRMVPSGFIPSVAWPGESFQSRDDGVTHPAILATSCRSAPPAPRSFRLLFGPPVGVFGVGHPASPAMASGPT